MATIWARTDGNWNGSIWNYFNEVTQQIETYPYAKPQADDIVYLNNHTILIPVPTYSYIQVAEIHNDLNPYTNQIGGHIQLPNSTSNTEQLTFECNFYGRGYESSDLILTDGVDANYNYRNVNLNINGNISNVYIYADYRSATTFNIIGNVINSRIDLRHSTTGANKTINITGNTSNFTFYNTNSGVTTLTINGNVTNVPISLITGSAGKACNINGSIKFLQGNEFIHSVGVNGIADLSDLASEDTIEYPFASGYGLIKRTDITVKTIKLTDYPAEYNVKKDVVYDFGNKVGLLDQVINQVGCVTKEDVREGVPLIGMYEDGQQVVGTIVIPNEEDVREGVHYDNDKIGTLIVQGGGDRLRIADFGYYTNAQSDTYIVDITEADKPKFASAEERILIEMFPSLDLDNIPQMYFDDLFVKYLKYRLIVEYYRTAGINSTFTPSEPTTEIVNYRNVTCEVWLNSANTYLNAWNKKYDLNESPKKVRL